MMNADHKRELDEAAELVARAARHELADMIESFAAILTECGVLRAELVADRAAVLDIVRQHGDVRTLRAFEAHLSQPNWLRQPIAGSA